MARDFDQLPECDPNPEPVEWGNDDLPADTVWCYDCERWVDRLDALRRGAAFICVECDAAVDQLPFED